MPDFGGFVFEGLSLKDPESDDGSLWFLFEFDFWDFVSLGGFIFSFFIDLEGFSSLFASFSDFLEFELLEDLSSEVAFFFLEFLFDEDSSKYFYVKTVYFYVEVLKYNYFHALIYCLILF